MNTYNKSAILKEAHRKHNSGQFTTLSDALKQTWLEEKFNRWYQEYCRTDEKNRDTERGDCYDR